MTREEVEQEQVLNGFTEMMKGLWKNQDLEVPNFKKPCKQETCEDCISRQEALNAITMAEVRWQAIENVNKLPSITPQQEPCEDCISRQAVLDMAITIVTYDYSGNETMDVVDIDDVKALSPVTLQPKTGHWIDDGFYAEGHSHKAFHCSKCGHNVLGFKEDLSNYCPNCGTKMQEVEK